MVTFIFPTIKTIIYLTYLRLIKRKVVVRTIFVFINTFHRITIHYVSSYTFITISIPCITVLTVWNAFFKNKIFKILTNLRNINLLHCKKMDNPNSYNTHQTINNNMNLNHINILRSIHIHINMFHQLTEPYRHNNILILL